MLASSIFLLCMTKISFLELLSESEKKFEQLQQADFLSVQYVNKTITNTFIFNQPPAVTYKKLDKRQVYGQYGSTYGQPVTSYKQAYLLQPQTSYYGPQVNLYGEQSDYIKYEYLLKQRIWGNAIQQCPCVIKPGTDKCIAYDSRYQAASIEEALVAFPDFTLDDEIYLETSREGVIDASVYACQTLECQTCAALLLNRLKEVGLVPLGLQISIQLPKRIKPENCRRLKLARRRIVPDVPPTPDYVRKLVERGLQYADVSSAGQIPVDKMYLQIYPALEDYFWSSTTLPSSVKPLATTKSFISYNQSQRSRWGISRKRGHENGYVASYPHTASRQYSAGTSKMFATGRTYQHSNSRVKKQAEINDATVLGRRYLISCVERGEVDSANLMALCRTCWTWRKLPSDYFPPLINELVCVEGNDAHCLSGWGQCRQKYRQFDVLKNVNGNWQPTTISTAACCNCHVRAGTEIHALVVGAT